MRVLLAIVLDFKLDFILAPSCKSGNTPIVKEKERSGTSSYASKESKPRIWRSDSLITNNPVMPGGFENFTSTSFYLPVSDTGTFVAQKARFQFTCPSKTQRCMRSAIHLTSSLRVVPSNLQLWLISFQFLAAKKLVNLTTGLGLHGSPSDHHVQTSTLGTPKLLLWSIDEMQSDAWKAKMFITFASFVNEAEECFE